MQSFTRSKDFEIFSNLLNCKRIQLSFKIARVAVSINTSFYEGKSEKQNVHFNPSQNLKFCLLQNDFVKRTLYFPKLQKYPCYRNHGLSFKTQKFYFKGVFLDHKTWTVTRRSRSRQFSFKSSG